MKKLLKQLNYATNKGVSISAETALQVLQISTAQIADLLNAATKMRQFYCGDKINLCSIMNAKSGACPENCAFCAQSSHHNTDIAVYNLKTPNEIKSAYDDASKLPINKFGIVTSGTSLNDQEIDTICTTIKIHRNKQIGWCGSLGAVSEKNFKTLKTAGLHRFHHNIETAESFFPNICSTHTYQDKVNTIKMAQQCGLEVCVGGILGMGESLEQRVEMAMALQKLAVDAIPLNFLVPIKNTKLAQQEPLKPLDIIRSIAMFRLTNPKAEIKICAGRTHLRDLVSLVFMAGANGLMIGNFLTTSGRNVAADLQMLQDLEYDL